MSRDDFVQKVVYFHPVLDADLLKYMEPHYACHRGSGEVLRLMRLAIQLSQQSPITPLVVRPQLQTPSSPPPANLDPTAVEDARQKLEAAFGGSF